MKTSELGDCDHDVVNIWETADWLLDWFNLTRKATVTQITTLYNRGAQKSFREQRDIYSNPVEFMQKGTTAQQCFQSIKCLERIVVIKQFELKLKSFKYRFAGRV